MVKRVYFQPVAKVLSIAVYGDVCETVFEESSYPEAETEYGCPWWEEEEEEPIL